MQHYLKDVQFGAKTWRLIQDSYHGGGVALLLTTPEGEPSYVCTVNVPEDPLLPGYVYIKNYAENEGILDALVQAEVVRDTGQRLLTGYVSLAVCQVLIPLKEGACPPNAS